MAEQCIEDISNDSLPCTQTYNILFFKNTNCDNKKILTRKSAIFHLIEISVK